MGMPARIKTIPKIRNPSHHAPTNCGFVVGIPGL